MALNTTPGPECESLITAAAADVYHEARSNSAKWNAIDAMQKEAMLRRAYDWLFAKYSGAWPTGLPFGASAFDVDGVAGVPRLMIGASAQLALYAIDGPFDSATPATVAPQVVERTIGPITTKFANVSAAASAPQERAFPDVERMVAACLPQRVASLSLPLRRG